jgi:hypothetical protein
MPTVEFSFMPGDRVMTCFGDLGLVAACRIEHGFVGYCVRTRDSCEWWQAQDLRPAQWKEGQQSPVRFSSCVPPETIPPEPKGKNQPGM